VGYHLWLCHYQIPKTYYGITAVAMYKATALYVSLGPMQWHGAAKYSMEDQHLFPFSGHT
jgi:hypothetical protein